MQLHLGIKAHHSKAHDSKGHHSESLESESHESEICLAAIVAIMLLTASAILYLGAQYHVTTHALARMPLVSPL